MCSASPHSAPGPCPQTGTIRGSLSTLGQNHEPKQTSSQLTQTGSVTSNRRWIKTRGPGSRPSSRPWARRVPWPGVGGVQPAPERPSRRLGPRQDPVSRVGLDNSWSHPGPSAPGCPRTVSSHPSVPRPHLDPQSGQEHSGKPSRALEPWRPLHSIAKQPSPSHILLKNSQLAPVPCLSLPPGPTLCPDSPGQGQP